VEKPLSQLVQFNYKSEIAIFIILFLASTGTAIFHYSEWENSEERIKHNALALFSGDEPFYLESISSLARFQSLSTSAHFTSLEKDPFLELPPLYYEVHSCRLHHSLTAGDGECYLPSSGLSLILAPAYTLFGFVGSMSTICFLFAIQGMIFYKISNKFTSKNLAFVLSLIVSFSTILFSFSSEIYPDFFAGFFILLAFYFFYFRKITFLNIIIVGFSLGFLPIIKSYFMIFPILLLPIMIFVLLKNKQFHNVFHLLASFTIFILIFISLSSLTAPIEVTPGVAGGYAFFFLYSLSNISDFTSMITDIGIGFQSLLFDQATGLIAFSPLVLVSIFGIKYLYKKDKFLTISIALSSFVFIGIFAFISPFAGGWSLPSRNLIPVLPILLIPFFPMFERFKKNIPFHFIILIFSYIGVSLNIIFAKTIYGHFTMDGRKEILSDITYNFSHYLPNILYDYRIPYPGFYEFIHPFFSFFIIILLFTFFSFSFSSYIKIILTHKKYKIIFLSLIIFIFTFVSYSTIDTYSDYNVENSVLDTFNQTLKRDPTNQEIQFWKNSLLNDETTIEIMQKSLDDSDEGLVVSKITKIYDSTLQREPDTIGLNHWKQKILNNEISFEQLEKMIKNSPEAMMINEN
tara:strand:+ start:2541 stop:4436 length:1896 start_codon:yes stop_codon:yes gene_type:complete